MLWSDIRTGFRQFPFLPAARFAAARFLMRLFDKYAAPTYSQFGEDRLLPLLLDAHKPGFYVDVGANQPIRWSNTLALYKQGWRGVTIDANAALVDWHRRVRPEDKQVHAAVSDQEADLLFTEFEEHQFSSLTPSHVEEFSKCAKVRGQRMMRTRTLASILDEFQVPKDFAFLNVDVEGHDLMVLRSLDWNRYRPGLVVVEMKGLMADSPDSDPAYNFLTAQRYRLRAFDTMNGYFTALA